MDITFTLQSTYTGSTYNAGPFNISGTTCDGTEYILATGVTKNQLITGYTVSTIYETISGGTIASVGVCTTTQNWLTGINCTSGTTHNFSLFCTVNQHISPLGSAQYPDVRIDNSQFITPPTYDTYIRLSGVEHQGYIYIYNATDNSPITPSVRVAQVLTEFDFICDDGQPTGNYCYTDNLGQTHSFITLEGCQAATRSNGYGCFACVGLAN